MAGLVQGVFKPKHPEKYKGDVHKIIYRSSYELKFLMELDRDPSVVSYSSEEVIVWYVSPLDRRKHRYFVDFYVERKVDDKIIKQLIEIKPSHQLKAPVQTPRKRRKTFLNEVATFAVNQAKWEAATKFAESRGWVFEVWTERELKIVK